jgi:tripartite-type tricarboxylate transporter receptor subunit TctC
MTCAVRFAGVLAAVVVCGSSVACAQMYPLRPIRLIVSTTAGGSPDFVARLMANNLAPQLGYQVVVDNRAGGSGVIGVQTVARSSPDGHTLLIATTNFVTIPLIKDPPPYQVLRDFAPITYAAQAPNILVVRPGLPVKTVADLIALARSQPGKLNYATGSSGASPHLAAELFNHMAKVATIQVAYRGAAQALIDLAAGQVDFMFATAVSVAPHIKAGRVRPIAITSLQVSSQAPDLPTVASSSLPGYESGVHYGFLAPAGTPQAIARRLNAEMVRILKRQDIVDLLRNDGSDVIGSTPEGYATFLKNDMAKWGAVIKVANIRMD